MRFLAVAFIAAALLGSFAVAVDVVIALKPRNVQALENVLLDVSNPKSPNYGQYVLGASFLFLSLFRTKNRFFSRSGSNQTPRCLSCIPETHFKS